MSNSNSKAGESGFKQLSEEGDSHPVLPYVKVQVYDANEETTTVETAILLRVDNVKRWLVVPIMSLLTIFVWPVFLYWKKPLQRDWLYKRAQSIEAATHIYIEGKDGNKEIVSVRDYSDESDQLLD